MRVSGGRRAGRGHRQQEVPCQDAFAVWSGTDRAATAVADGLGSRSRSHEGSDVACRAAVAHLATEPAWDQAALLRAFEAASGAIELFASEQNASADEFATTLQIAALADGKAVAAMVGDGAVVAGSEEPRLLLAPEPGEYANEVVPLTDPRWRAHFRYAEESSTPWVLAFTDGLTRLLLSRTRGAWAPFRPFFDVFLPQIRDGAFEDSLVADFLATDTLDASWDDDKTLVVIARDGPHL